MSEIQEIIDRLKQMYNKNYEEREVYDSRYLVNKYSKIALKSSRSCANTDRSINSDIDNSYQAYK